MHECTVFRPISANIKHVKFFVSIIFLFLSIQAYLIVCFKHFVA